MNSSDVLDYFGLGLTVSNVQVTDYVICILERKNHHCAENACLRALEECILRQGEFLIRIHPNSGSSG